MPFVTEHQRRYAALIARRAQLRTRTPNARTKTWLAMIDSALVLLKLKHETTIQQRAAWRQQRKRTLMREQENKP